MDRMPERIDSKFRYILLAAERAEQLMQGARPKVDLGPKKVTRTAMEEISNDLVEWDYGPPPEEIYDELGEDGLEVEEVPAEAV